MLVLITPAKRLYEEQTEPFVAPSRPDYVSKAEAIVAVLRKHSKKELTKLFGVSDKLAELNYERFIEWSTSHTQSNSFKAVDMFDGDVYKELSKRDYDKQQQALLQENARIISGLYGILRPYDLVHPYRLEMGTKLTVGGSDRISTYWQPFVAKHINAQDSAKDGVLSLLSAEYRAAVSDELIDADIYDTDFKEWKDGKYKTIGLLAKRARGKLLDYLVQKRDFSIDSVRSFNSDGYSLHDESGSTIIFSRKQ